MLDLPVSTMSAAAAMAICSSIASGMIALTGIVFSLAFVMVQFSATAYSPRLVVWMSRDPVMSHALGVFSATFLYALGLLAWVDRESTGRVPWLSTWLVVLLLVASMGMFIALIKRIENLQVSQMLIFTGDQGRAAIEQYYGPESVLAGSVEGPDLRFLPVTQTVVHLGRPRSIQAVDEAALAGMATEADAVIQFTAAIGDTVVEQAPLLRVYQASAPLDEAALRRAIELGDERTFEQDPKYALRLVVDIAIRALSPAINDPTTAVQAIDQIEDLLLRLGRHRLERGWRVDAAGRPRFKATYPGWDDFLRLALDEIRAYGAESVQVMRRMNALITNLQTMLPPERQPALAHWRERLRGSIARSFEDADEQLEASVSDRQGLGLGHDPAATARQAAPATGDSPSEIPPNTPTVPS